MNRYPHVVVALEHHFIRVNGGYYTTLAFHTAYWQEYHAVFDKVMVVARVDSKESVPEGYLLADGPGITFLEMPYYLGFKQFVLKLPQSFLCARRYAKAYRCFILRSGNISTLLWFWLLWYRRTYAREVQGDILTAVTEYGGGRLGYRIIANLMEQLCKVQVRLSSACSYVSQSLRKQYPTSRVDCEFVFSSVNLSADAMRKPAIGHRSSGLPFVITSVGRLEKEKGHHVLLQAAKRLQGYFGARPWHIQLIGDGSQREKLEALASELGISKYVHFLGMIPCGPKLWEKLDESSLFVLPSLTEGMPRALIEAMARSLPAVASAVGGVPEVLSAEQLVDPGDSIALADRVYLLAQSEDCLKDYSERNYSVVSERYTYEAMQRAKISFWGCTGEKVAYW